MIETPSAPVVLTADDFRSWIGKAIAFVGEGAILTLDHIVEDPKEASAGAVRRPFILVFHGVRARAPEPDFLPDGIYDCGPEGGPTRTIHVSPIHTPHRDRQDYQAAFN